MLVKDPEGFEEPTKHPWLWFFLGMLALVIFLLGATELVKAIVEAF